MNLLGVLGAIFVVLKLVGVIAWSWWLVLAPIYVPLAVMFLFYFFVTILIGTVVSNRKK